MSGEHTHPDLDGLLASLVGRTAATEADIKAAAERTGRLTAQVVALEAAAAARPGHLVLGDKTSRTAFRSNEVLKLPIRGETQFLPPAGGGQRLLALYANVWLPKPGTVDRERLWRGGWRAWVQQVQPSESGDRDETGFIGPVMIPKMGDGSLLISHTWPHGVTDGVPWEFCIEVRAFGSDGKPRSVPLTLGTRQVKIIAI